MNLKEKMRELKFDAIHHHYRMLWELSVRLDSPVFKWLWKSIVYEKKNRDQLWLAYQKDLNNVH